MNDSAKNNPTILSIISGKGGSGKTSLALSLAQVLSYCKINVLLLDCDFVTNGCTLFFEDQLTSELTVQELIQTNTKEQKMQKSSLSDQIIHVNQHFHFIPSIVNTKNFKLSRSESFTFECIEKCINELGSQIVILDCQAGYSYVTEFFLKHSSVNLIVLEADAISVSAVRVLYSKISKALDSAKTYQVFNKITQEEYDLFSKVTAGTMFPNLTPILFDWSVRKSFAVNQLPEINIHKIVFSTYVLELAQALFPKWRKEIDNFIYLTKKAKLDAMKAKNKEFLQISPFQLSKFQFYKFFVDFPGDMVIYFLCGPLLFVFILLWATSTTGAGISIFFIVLSLFGLGFLGRIKNNRKWEDTLETYEEIHPIVEALEEEVEQARSKLGTISEQN